MDDPSSSAVIDYSHPSTEHQQQIQSLEEATTNTAEDERLWALCSSQDHAFKIVNCIANSLELTDSVSEPAHSTSVYLLVGCI